MAKAMYRGGPRGGLTEQRSALIDAYFSNGFNKIEAMKTAGYSSPRQSMGNIFSQPVVKAEIERRRKALTAKSELNAEWVLKRLMRVANAPETLAKFKKVDAEGTLWWDFTDATDEDLACITELQTETYVERGSGKVKKFKVGTADVMAALTALARHLGMFNDKLTVQWELSLVERLQKGRDRVKSGE